MVHLSPRTRAPRRAELLPPRLVTACLYAVPAALLMSAAFLWGLHLGLR